VHIVIYYIDELEQTPINVSQSFAEKFSVFFEDIESMKNVKSLYKQKYFVIGFPILLEKYFV
jgi:hypothetical protein